MNIRTITLFSGCIALLLPYTGKGQDSKISIEFATVPRDEIGRRLEAGEVHNKLREPTLHFLFEASGCAGEKLVEQHVRFAKSPNLICTLDGESAATILVGGHFDFVDAGTGLVDNWSGSSLLPSLYQSLKDKARRHTFRFVGFTDEEKGLVGSRYYVDKLSKEEAKDIRAMINLDSLGTTSTKVELVRGDKSLAGALGAVSSTLKLPLSVVDVHGVGRSDSDSFEDRHIPSINIHSLTTQTFPILHSRKDTVSAIQMDDYYNSYLLIRAYLAYLDEMLDRPGAAEKGK